MSKQLILRYWNSWQTPSDFDEMQACLADDVKMSSGMGPPLTSSKDFRAMVEANPAPWRDVTMVSSHFHEEGGTIVYEGVNTENGQGMRVAELIRVKGDRIVGIDAVYGMLPPS